MDLRKPTGAMGTVLLADDDAQLRAYIGLVLQQRGFLVIEARDASEAVDMFREYSGEIELLLTDVNMGGGLDGVSLARELQSQRPELAILVISGRPEAKRAAAERGFSFLCKPFTPARLGESVRQALRIRRQPPNSRRSAGGGR